LPNSTIMCISMNIDQAISARFPDHDPGLGFTYSLLTSIHECHEGNSLE